MAARLRRCRACFAPTTGWWCSDRCRRAEDGDEREPAER